MAWNLFRVAATFDLLHSNFFVLGKVESWLRGSCVFARYAFILAMAATMECSPIRWCTCVSAPSTDASWSIAAGAVNSSQSGSLRSQADDAASVEKGYGNT